ncbi:unnamed protein product [Lupinus luteus]|uniref:Uncharacterized protein n=1 Tax=Lupinus luteus TaxID=3873 RepID=A0AAV1WZH7_LUPLU
MINDYLGNPPSPHPNVDHDLRNFQLKLNSPYYGEGEGHEHDEDNVRRSLYLQGLEVNESGPIFLFYMTQVSQLWTICVVQHMINHTCFRPSDNKSKTHKLNL